MEYFADVSNFQWKSDYAGYEKFLRAAKSKYKIKSTCILMSDGDSFKSPFRNEQIKASLKLFGSLSCYHFFRGNVQAEANNFLEALKQARADKSTVLMIDAEVRLENLTSKVNEFIGKLKEAGYNRIYIYSMGSMLDYTNTGIQTGNLRHGTKVWIASYGSIQPGGADVWQFTSTANANGISFDLNKDFVGELSNGAKETTFKPKNKPKKATYWQYGRLFQVKSDLKIYEDIDLKHKTDGIYKKDSSVFINKVVKPNGDKSEFSRFKVDGGYVSANTAFSHRIK